MLAFALLVLAAPPAEGLARARALMDDLEYEAALDELKAVIVDVRADEDTRVEAYLLGGVAAVIVNRETEARLYFLSALKARPTAELPVPYGSPPRIAAFFSLVKNELTSPAGVSAARASAASTPDGQSPATEPAGPPSTWALASGTAAVSAGLASAATYGIALAAAERYRDTTAATAERADARALGAAMLVTSAVAMAGGITFGALYLAEAL